jgi:PAS domain S-box-containing protein
MGKRAVSRTPNPWRVFLTVLLTIFSVEVAVMVVLPLLVPSRLDERIVALADACLLTFAAAPILWWIVIRPLRRLAVTEEAKAESIVAAAAEGIVTVDERGDLDSFNPAAEQIFGYAAEEVVGHSLTMLMPAESAAQHQQALLRYRTGGESQILGQLLEVMGLRKDGRQVPLSLSVSPLEVGGCRFFTGILRDLTEPKYRARQQAAMVEFGKRALVHDQLDQLLREAAVCVADTLHVDFSAVFQLSASGETLQLTHGVGWPTELIGEAIIDAKGEYSPGRALQETVVLNSDFESNRGSGLELLRDQGIRAGGAVAIQTAPRPYGVLAAYRREPRPLADDELHFLRDVAVEITLAMQRQRSEMQHRERDQNRADQMSAIAQLAMGVAHEIRNPLTSVKMLIQIGRRTASQGLEAGDLEVIESEIRRMERSLNAFLDFARPAEPERKRLALLPLVDRTLALIESRAARQGVRLQRLAPESIVEVWADEDQMQQLLLNLVLNSLDAIPDGGRLWIEIDPPCDGEFELRVIDTGPGIPRELMNRLFQPFVSGKDTGIGLGLVICKRIAEDHGGSLSAGNRPEGGACFTLRMPPSIVDTSQEE